MYAIRRSTSRVRDYILRLAAIDVAARDHKNYRSLIRIYCAWLVGEEAAPWALETSFYFAAETLVTRGCRRGTDRQPASKSADQPIDGPALAQLSAVLAIILVSYFMIVPTHVSEET